jgi:3-methylfumaryl-CoA hydratase
VTLDITSQRAHLGRVVVQEDVATPVPMRGMAVTFHRKDAAPVPGEAIPPGWYSAYFLPSVPVWELNPDGTPQDNGVLPEMPLPRRMHVGIKTRFLEPIRVGDALRRENRFSGLELREGRTGAMLLSTQTRSIFGPRGLAIEEEYLQMHLPQVKPGSGGAAGRPGEAAPLDAPWQRTVTPDAIDLFRFSALTFNAHRIHYDRAFACGVEGFPGVVVHGMFTAQCLIDLARDRLPGQRIIEFSFRAVAPLFEGRPIRLLGSDNAAERTAQMWAATPEGPVAMKASVRWE